jgi:hypothetical protein
MRTETEIDADARPGSPFSNGTEGYAWMGTWCDECVNNDEETELWCPILSVALLGKTPSEWIEQPWGQIKGRPEGETAPSLTDRYHCTEFVQRPEWPGRDGPDGDPPPGPVPVGEGQLDLVDAYLDTAVAELSKAPTARPVGAGKR